MAICGRIRDHEIVLGAGPHDLEGREHERAGEPASTADAAATLQWTASIAKWA